MSQSDLIDFNFDVDAQDQTNMYPASDIQWIYINDNNQGNYANGWVNWSNISLIGSSSDKFFDWSQAYAVIPYGVVLTASGTGVPSFGSTNGTNFTHSPENVFAVAPKGNHHLIDLVQAKFGGVSINRNSNYNNFYINETFKSQSTDQAKLLGDIMCSYLDDADSYYIDATLGDINNRLTGKPTNLASGNNGTTFANSGFLKRCVKSNHDNTTYAANTSIFNTNATHNNTAFLNSLSQGLVGCYDSTGTISSGSTNRNTRLVFQYVATVPLCEVNDFFQKLPLVQSSLGFELRTQLNVASNNSWVVTYAGAAKGAEFPINSIVANQSVGNTCPFLVSPASNTINSNAGLGLGMAVNATSATAWSLNVNPFIGYFGNAPNLVNGLPSGSTSLPCRIYVPQINYTPSYTKMILNQPSTKLLYNDFYVDMILNQNTATTNQVTRLFNVNLSRVRTMYIMPYLSSKANSPVSYRSPISSAPTTCSFCRISNCNISIGGQNVYIEPLQQINQFYNNNVLPLIANVNGNSMKSKFMSGQITSTMWQKAYNVFTFDMKKVEDEVQDNVLKSFQINFKVDTVNTYDFMVILSYQNELNVDRLTGMVTSGN